MMKKVRGSALAKVLAIVLLLAAALACAASLMGLALLEDFGALQGGDADADAAVIDTVGWRRLRSAAYRVAEGLAFDPLGRDMEDTFSYDAEGLSIRLTDSEGKLLLSRGEESGSPLWEDSCELEYRAQYQSSGVNDLYFNVDVVVYDRSFDPVAYMGEFVFSVPQTIDGPVLEYLGQTEGYRGAELPEPRTAAGGEATPTDPVILRYTLTGELLQAEAGGEGPWQLELILALIPYRFTLIGVCLSSLLLGALLFVFLMCAAGHRDGSDTVTANFSDKVPTDLFAAMVGAGAFTGVFFGIELIFERLNRWDYLSYGYVDPLYLSAALLLVVAGLVLAVWLCMSLATRLKLGTVIKNSLCWRAAVLCWRILRALWRGFVRLWRGFWQAFGKLLRNISLLWRAILAIGVLLLLEFIVIVSTEYDPGIELFLWFIESAALALLVLYAILCLHRLQKGLREIARGNESYTVDTQYLRGDFKEAAQDLNNIQAGISRAVNERMKSERFKTELITNVSHDIKTPLTSIINYVDLLSKEEPENERVREYIEVLSRQSDRLKKLIEDLIEASKASSGNLSVNLEHCDLGVLLDQAAGEYAEKLAAARLELVVKKPEEAVTVLADGRHTWRIFDNLMNNACKYALPGTRVYLDLERKGKTASVTFRNISRSQLNISGEELMERFVRGDASRSTEGSGLGLSIARSLAQLQGGGLDITVDGDLFKVTLRFDNAI